MTNFWKPGEEHEHVEGCLCGVELADDELTLDSELPEAFGGLEVIAGGEFDNSDTDGCDLEFGGDDTADADLPVASDGASI